MVHNCCFWNPRTPFLPIRVLVYKMFKKRGPGAGFLRLRNDLESGERERGPDEMRGLWKKSWLAVGVMVGLIIVAGLALPDKHMGGEMNGEGGGLMFVAVANRHGARAPLGEFDFEVGEVKWSLRLGALTPTGMVQAFNLGRNLRRSYLDEISLGNVPITEKMAVFCTEIDRTSDTANSLLLGFFSPNNVKVNTASGDCSCRPNRGDKSSLSCIASCLGVPVPNVNIPPVTELKTPLLLQFDKCKGWPSEVDALKRSKPFLNYQAHHFSKALKSVKKVVGKDKVCTVKASINDKEEDREDECENVDYEVMERVWDSAVCAKTEGLKYPNVDDYDAFLEPLLEETTWDWHQKYATNRSSLAAGILIDEIINRMESFLPNRDASLSQEKDAMVVYSAHDSSLAALLSVLGIVDWKIPHFTSKIALELRAHDIMDDNSFFVRLLYDEDLLIIPGCATDCPWKDFISILNPRRMNIDTCENID